MTRKRMADEQEKLFNEIRALVPRIRGLAGFVQNDFSELLSDGIVSSESLKRSLKDVDEAYDKMVRELLDKKERTKEIIRYYIKER